MATAFDFGTTTDAHPAYAAPVPAYPKQEQRHPEDPPDHDPRELRERVRSGPHDVRFPWFLPFYDPAQTTPGRWVVRPVEALSFVATDCDQMLGGCSEARP